VRTVENGEAMKQPIAFLSHSSANAELAERLARDLLEQGVEVWYSQWEIKAGDSLRRKIDAGIDQANYFLVLLTPSSLKSVWVQTELDAGMVKKIEGACRLIPILLGIERGDVPATLRGLLSVSLEVYDDGLRKLLEACHDVSTKPALGKAPAWARQRPLEGLDLSADAQRMAAWINQHSEDGTTYQDFERDEIMKDLELTPDQAGMAAGELEDFGYVKRDIDTRSGAAGFSSLQPLPALFFGTDPVLQGWDPEQDAVALAAAMINVARSDLRPLGRGRQASRLGATPLESRGRLPCRVQLRRPITWRGVRALHLRQCAPEPPHAAPGADGCPLI
jgi:TIR domain